MVRIERKGAVEELWWDNLLKAQESTEPDHSSPFPEHPKLWNCSKRERLQREAPEREASERRVRGGGVLEEEPRTCTCGFRALPPSPHISRKEKAGTEFMSSSDAMHGD